MDLRTLAKKISAIEGKKEEISIAQISEVIWALRCIMQSLDEKDLRLLLDNMLNVPVKNRKKAKK